MGGIFIFVTAQKKKHHTITRKAVVEMIYSVQSGSRPEKNQGESVKISTGRQKGRKL